MPPSLPSSRGGAVLVGVQLPGVTDADHASDLAELGRRKVDAPGRAEKASVIERAPDRDHLQKPAQPVAGIFHIDLVCETNRHIVEIICHSEYQM